MKRLFSCADFKGGDLSIIGLPSDKNASFRQGASNGPEAIRAASQELETYLPDRDLELRDLRFSDLGDVSLDSIPVLEAGKKYLFLGGDHSVTYHSFRKVREAYPDLFYLCFDAHTDMRKKYQGNPDSNACVNRKISELIGLERVSFRHVRTGSREEFDFSKDCFDRKIKDNVYISIDLDVLDPSVMPSVGNPEPGGISFRELVDELDILFKDKGINPVAADVVELTSQSTDNSALTAAKLVQYLISYMVSK
jgi:agmatinase